MSRTGESLKTRHYLSRALIAGVVMIAAAALVIGQTREVFNATALSTGGPEPPVAGRLTFSIDRWSTADESQKLNAALKKGGTKDVVRALSDMKVAGRISSPGSIGYPLMYAVQDMLGDGVRHIVLMTDRPMSFSESWWQPPTVDYPVTYVELKVDKDGRGTGKVALTAKLIPAGKLIVAEDWGSLIQLREVKKQN
jgi:hypothetical protein